MAEELQGLLDRIRKEGLDKAEAEARTVIEAAEKKAAKIKKAAETEAAKKREEAKEEAAKLEQRSVSAIEQAARDIVLSVGDAVQVAFEALVNQKISDSLAGEQFAKLVHTVIESYTQQENAGNIDVLLSKKQQEEVASHLLKLMKEELRNGVTIQSSRGVISGFSIVLRDQGIEHDFRGETLTAAFLEILRPQLGEMVKKAMETVKKTS